MLIFIIFNLKLQFYFNYYLFIWMNEYLINLNKKNIE